jgi:hypothetical protein
MGPALLGLIDYDEVSPPAPPPPTLLQGHYGEGVDLGPVQAVEQSVGRLLRAASEVPPQQK